MTFHQAFSPLRQTVARGIGRTVNGIVSAPAHVAHGGHHFTAQSLPMPISHADAAVACTPFFAFDFLR